MAINSINNNFASTLNSASSLVNNAVKLAADLKGGNVAGAIKDIGTMFKEVGNLVGSQPGNVSKSNPMPDMSKLFGTDFSSQQENEKKAAAKAAGSGASGGPMSLGALLAMVGGILVKSIESTMKQLQDAAKQLDSASSSGGPTAALNQKIQELTFNLQQIQQTLNRVNETVTNLSRSQSDAQKTTAQNLSV
ncbi:MAG: hypothetical protein WAQ98_14940 [Blastocatellia bacterium]